MGKNVNPQCNNQLSEVPSSQLSEVPSSQIGCIFFVSTKVPRREDREVLRFAQACAIFILMTYKNSTVPDICLAFHQFFFHGEAHADLSGSLGGRAVTPAKRNAHRTRCHRQDGGRTDIFLLPMRRSPELLARWPGVRSQRLQSATGHPRAGAQPINVDQPLSVMRWIVI